MRTVLIVLIICLGTAISLTTKNNTKECSSNTITNDITKSILISSVDLGKTWEDVGSNFPKDAQINCAFAKGNEVFLGADDDIVYYCPDINKGKWVREDIGISFPSIGNIMPSNYRMIGLFDGKSGVYANVYGSGIYFRSSTTGKWKPIPTAFQSKNIHSLVEMPDGRIYISNTDGIFITNDDGASWQNVYSDTRVNNLITKDGTLIGSSSQGLIRSTDGIQWDVVLEDIKGINYDIRVTDDGFLAVRAPGWRPSGTENLQRTFMSSDVGKTWKRLDQNLSPVRAIYNIDKEAKHLLSTENSGIYRSLDGGNQWELVINPTKDNEPWRYLFLTTEKTILAVKVFDGC